MRRRTAWATLLLLLVLVAAGARAGDDLVGTLPFGVHFARYEDTLPDLAVAYGVGYTELVTANPAADPWLPGRGTLLLLPTAHILPDAPRRGIVINLAEQRLYVFPAQGPVRSFPIGIGTEAAGVRTGQTRVRAKRIDPTWVPTASVRQEMPELPAAVPPGPDNPLGPFALDLEWTSIVIHGTNRPYGIGRRVSHGCFRLYNPDIAALFALVAVGTPVSVVDQPAKLGWHDGDLYLEVHPTVAQADELEAEGRITPGPLPGLNELLLRVAGPRAADLDWGLVRKAEWERTGLPVRILVAERAGPAVSTE
ncbi:L,D-transpeptidase family protein [Azospirillum sp. ST 5-10]|uniref:L,D-transpeptidase family protein n=1 Tax=unclassified Azospirillum TaxID=2630922 RepID=UPI003F4A583D